MNFPHYQGSSEENTSTLPTANQSRVIRPEPKTYIPDDNLKAAVNVALMLGRPLLLTGAPGCGKTQLAYHIAWEMQELDEVLRFDTKSTSTARDLFYTYDAVAHFHAAQIRQKVEGGEVIEKLSPLQFIQANALGLAILRGQTETELKEKGLLQLLPEEEQIKHQPRHSIVLIDEIDKAPRDFPNDLLNEIDELYFTIPELNNLRIDIKPEFRPILVMTSNSEKHLPDAFLRRCVYHHIAFPDEQRITAIIHSHFGDAIFAGKPQLFADAQRFFFTLRGRQAGLRKEPDTAELLDWLWVLEHTTPADKTLPEQDEQLILSSFSSLIKNAEDQAAVQRQWNNHKSQTHETD